METIAILLVFFIIVFIGLVFYSNIIKSKTNENIGRFQELAKIEKAQIASSLPELQCSEDNILKSNCVDIIKLGYAEELMRKNDLFYYDLFGYGKITVEKIFPADLSTWVIYNKQPSKEFNQSINRIYLPISLFDAIEQNNYFGLMIVEVYS